MQRLALYDKFALFAVLVASMDLTGCFYPTQAALDKDSPGFPYATCGYAADQPNSKDSPPGTSSTNFTSALTFAKSTKQNYTDFLADREKIKLGFGLGLIGLAGASLGLTTTAASTVAATATGLASGTGLAGYTFLQNKAKDTAYTQAENQLQCVITKASILEPLRASSTDPARNLSKEIGNLTRNTGVLAEKVRDTELSCEKSNVNLRHPTGRGRLAVAEAMATLDRAKTLETAYEFAPVSIVNSVCAIDSSAFVAAQGGVPDAAALATAIGKVGPQPKPSGSSTGTTNPGTTPTVSLKIFGDEDKKNPSELQEQESGECKSALNQLGKATTTVNDGTKEIHDELASVSWTPQGFADCLKSNSATPSKTTPGASAALGGSAASATDNLSPGSVSTPSPGGKTAAFQVSLSILGWMPLKSQGTTGTVTVSGGLPPYRWYVVDPDTYAAQASEETSLVLNLKATEGDWRHRVLITDYAGSEVVVDVTPE
jgi:hypothetical protein